MKIKKSKKIGTLVCDGDGLGIQKKIIIDYKEGKVLQMKKIKEYIC